jgi:hypothetical protein
MDLNAEQSADRLRGCVVRRFPPTWGSGLSECILITEELKDLSMSSFLGMKFEFARPGEGFASFLAEKKLAHLRRAT